MYQGNKIVVVIPALNEEASIGNVLDRIPKYIDQVVVVNDGSTDRTRDIALSKGAIVVDHKQNKGLGLAFKSGLQRVLELDADVMVNMDADGQFNPDDIISLIVPIIEKKADFVTASRFKDPALWPEMSKIKFWGNNMMSRLISSIVNERFYDVSCGFRAYSKDTLMRLNLFGKFTYTQETFIDLAFKGLTIKELPTKVRGTREHGKSKMASNLFKFGYRTSGIILKAFRDYKPIRLFGNVALIFCLIGLGFFFFLMIHYFRFDAFSPYKWTGFTAAFFLTLSIIMIITGFIMDVFARMRQNQDELLYRQKKMDMQMNKMEHNIIPTKKV